MSRGEVLEKDRGEDERCREWQAEHAKAPDMSLSLVMVALLNLVWLVSCLAGYQELWAEACATGNANSATLVRAMMSLIFLAFSLHRPFTRRGGDDWLRSGRSHPTSRDTHRTMPEESTTRDLVELTRALGEARGVEATMQFYGPGAVYDMSRVGLGTFEGRSAIRRFLGDWLASYEETEDELQEITALGNGIVFAQVRESGHPTGSPTHSQVHAVYGFVFVWRGRKLGRVTVYTDPREARAAAERLAESRG